MNKIAFDDADRADLAFANITVELAHNLSSVLDDVLNLASDQSSSWHQKIDLGKIFAVGHSSGGSASFLACATDPRISKSVSLDGFLYMNKMECIPVVQ